MLPKQPPTFSCEICYLEYEKSNYSSSRPKGICYPCWKEHVKTSTMKISYQVGTDVMSPFEGRPAIKVEKVLNSLQPADREVLDEWLFKKYTTFTPDVEKCPSEACDYAFLLDKCDEGGMGSSLSCPKCDVPLSSEANFSIKSVLGLVYFIFIANKCPKCEIPIEKTSGCPHMSCPCGHQFCWFCLKDYSANAANVYSPHEPK